MFGRANRPEVGRDELIAALLAMPEVGTWRAHGWEFVRYGTPEGPRWTARRLVDGAEPLPPQSAEGIADAVLR